MVVCGTYPRGTSLCSSPFAPAQGWCLSAALGTITCGAMPQFWQRPQPRLLQSLNSSCTQKKCRYTWRSSGWAGDLLQSLLRPLSSMALSHEIKLADSRPSISAPAHLTGTTAGEQAVQLTNTRNVNRDGTKGSWLAFNILCSQIVTSYQFGAMIKVLRHKEQFWEGHSP